MHYDLTISPDDHMAFSGTDAYFHVTDSGAECIASGLADAGLDRTKVAAVLDFGCGYGRVFRALPPMFPNAICTALDLIAPAARFCADSFGGEPVQSFEDLGRIKLSRQNDVVWIGSVFTHLPKHRWASLLSFLSAQTAAGGIVVFTAHGEAAADYFEQGIMPVLPHLVTPEAFARLRRSLPETGFEYLPENQTTLDHSAKIGMKVTAGEYGFTFNTEAWIRAFVARRPEWKLLSYRPAAWAGNHDVITIRRQP
jgi:SAM-dependent methyltransferase